MSRMLLALQPEAGATDRILVAAAWAARLGLRLSLCTVVPSDLAAAPLHPDDARSADPITLHRNAVDWLEGLLPAIPEDQRGEAMVLTGKPHRALLDALTPDDLLAVGTHHRTDVMRLFLGSTAERLVREAPCSVLVLGDSAQAPPAEGPVRVRAPIDIAHPNRAALDWLARHVDTDTTAVYVLPWTSLIGPLPGTGHATYEATTSALAHALTDLGHGGTSGLVIVREEVNIGDAIAHEAQESGVHLIAMPTHARSGLLDALLGSVAERTVRAARTAVLVVR
jgi:nucleotide-binding universal stress UspA family protein